MQNEQNCTYNTTCRDVGLCEREGADMSGIAACAWRRWKIINEIIGDLHARGITVLFYFSVLVPFGLGVRLLSDPLLLRGRRGQWLDRPPVANGIDDARKQF